MKTKMLFIAVAIMLGVTTVAKAQEDMDVRVNSPQVTVYGFIYSYKPSTKDIYVSPVFSATKYGKEYLNASVTSLQLQWRKKLELVIDNYYDLRYTMLDYAFFESYDDVSDHRDEIIREYKNKNYSFHYVDDFYYRKKKYSDN